MSSDIDTKLEDAVYDTQVILGLGGFVPTEDFKKAFARIDAETFAKIIYASEKMLEEFEYPETVNPENIPLMIAKYDFRKERCFSRIEDIFRKHFGSSVAEYS